jgi:hypothetical protein
MVPLRMVRRRDGISFVPKGELLRELTRLAQVRVAVLLRAIWHRYRFSVDDPQVSFYVNSHALPADNRPLTGGSEPLPFFHWRPKVSFYVNPHALPSYC